MYELLEIIVCSLLAFPGSGPHTDLLTSMIGLTGRGGGAEGFCPSPVNIMDFEAHPRFNA